MKNQNKMFMAKDMAPFWDSGVSSCPFMTQTDLPAGSSLIDPEQNNIHTQDHKYLFLFILDRWEVWLAEYYVHKPNTTCRPAPLQVLIFTCTHLHMAGVFPGQFAITVIFFSPVLI